MAIVQAFRGWLYDLSRVGKLADVTAPPYDIIDPQRQIELYSRHPANVVRLILNQWQDGDEPEDRYRRAAEFWRGWKRNGTVAADKSSAFYVYHQVFAHQGTVLTRRGFICRLQIEPFGSGHVYPHEATHAGPKQDRLLLMRACRANFSPIFGLMPDADNEVQSVLERSLEDTTPLQVTDENGVVHRLWSVTDIAAISQVISLMGPKPIFIADGHHRYETAWNYRQELASQGVLTAEHPANFVMTACFSMNDPGLVVLPTHRLLRQAPNLDRHQFVEQLQGCFDCEPVAKGPQAAPDVWELIEMEDQQTTMGFYTARDQCWTLARLTETGRRRMEEISEASSSWNGLGVSILHKLAIEHLLGLKDMPTPLYVRGENEVARFLVEGDVTGRDLTGQQASGEMFNLAAMVMPARVQDVADISMLGERMPAKSTYFFPKLLTGLVFHSLAEDDG